MRHIPRRVPSALPFACIAALALAACRSTDERVEVRELVRRGEYARAVELGEERAARAPGDTDREADLRLARVAASLDAGVRASRAGDEERALKHFERALETDPESRAARVWRDRSLSLLAEAAQGRAKEAEAEGRFEDALRDYVEAFELWPSDPAGRAGAARILLVMNHRQGLGDSYYLNGVRAVQALALHEAHHRFAAANHQRPGDPRVQDRLDEVTRAIAEERIAIGREFEAEGQFRAAQNEYRLALLYAPELDSGIEALASAKNEVEVLELLDESRRLQQRGQFQLASARIGRAAAITKKQTAQIEAARSELDDARRRDLYRRARSRETDFRYEEAIALYTELLEETGYYDDAIARRDTLRSYVETAERLYREAMSTEDPARRDELLRQIRVFWPDYRDVRRLLAE